MSQSFTARVETSAEGCVVVLEGTISEQSEFEPIVADASGNVTIDLSGVRRINSLGVRDWVRFLEALFDKGCEVTLERCSNVMVEQFNMITRALGKARVRSILLPFYCPACDEQHTEELAVGPGITAASIPDDRSCPGCGTTLVFEYLPEEYVSFVADG